MNEKDFLKEKREIEIYQLKKRKKIVKLKL
jgi:hypothetical protein